MCVVRSDKHDDPEVWIGNLLNHFLEKNMAQEDYGNAILFFIITSAYAN